MSDTSTMPAAPLLGSGLIARQFSVAKEDVVFVKGVLEASEGVGALFAERGGDLVIAAPASREADLDEMLTDLTFELGARVAKTTVGCPDG